MLLPDELYRSVSGSEVPGWMRANRRWVPRLPFGEAVAVRVQSGPSAGVAATARAADLSPVGMRLIVSQPRHKGDQFAVRLARRHGGPVWVQCEVMRHKPVGEAMYETGARFQRVLNGQILG
jgi:hypothetical protein